MASTLKRFSDLIAGLEEEISLFIPNLNTNYYSVPSELQVSANYKWLQVIYLDVLLFWGSSASVANNLGQSWANIDPYHVPAWNELDTTLVTSLSKWYGYAYPPANGGARTSYAST